MSRALAITLLVVCLPVACSLPKSSVLLEQSECLAIQHSSLHDWFVVEKKVVGMSREERVAELIALGKPIGSDMLVYYGLLNQELNAYGSWIQARDAFRQLSEEPGLTPDQRQWALTLQQYNQNRINWYRQYQDLLTDYDQVLERLSAAEEQSRTLEKRIQAITELEATISTRKEQ